MKIVSVLNSEILKRKLDNGLTEVKALYPSGQLEFHYFLDKNCDLQGKWKRFFLDGTTWMEVDFVDAIKHGISLEYWPNGQLYIHEEYVYNKIHGESFEYDFAGCLVSHQLWENDELIKDYLNENN